MTADAMVWSEQRGAPARGVTGRLPQAVARLRSGAANPTPSWKIVQQRANVTVLDAEGGWGQVAGTRAMQVAVANAREDGCAVNIVRNVDITAALGWYAHVAIDAKMIGLAINNSLPLMAPWGGTERMLGNQAFAMGAPAGRHFPILFDSALSVLSLGLIRTAQRRGESLPPDVALDRHGQPTVDPAEALAGAILPVGGHKGYGLALLWEVLTGVLAGERMAPDVGGDPMGVSMFCLAVDPTAAIPYEDFVARVDALIDHLHASPTSPDAERVRVPGERGYEIAARYEREGVPVPAEARRQLLALADELGIAAPWTPTSEPRGR